MPFSIMTKIMFDGLSALIIANEAADGPLVAIILVVRNLIFLQE